MNDADSLAVADDHTAKGIIVREQISRWVDAVCVFALTVATVAYQAWTLGLQYIEQGTQLRRHMGVLQAMERDPWVFRVLSEYGAEALVSFARFAGLPHAVASGFIGFRLIQNAAIFALALACYRRLALSARESLVGLVLLGYAMSHALYNSDLSFNTYSDLIFYLLAAYIVLAGYSAWWLLPVSVLAALNRETSLLIPFLLLAPLVAAGGRDLARWKPQLVVTAVCLAAQVVTLVVLRILIEPFCGSSDECWGHSPGLTNLMRNLTSGHTLVLVFLAVTVLPVLLVWNRRLLPAWLKGAFWIVVPVWFVVHFYMALANETRLFLVPVALVLIPGALHSRSRPAAHAGGG